MNGKSRLRRIRAALRLAGNNGATGYDIMEATGLSSTTFYRDIVTMREAGQIITEQRDSPVGEGKRALHFLAEHSALTTGYISGEIEDGWRRGSRFDRYEHRRDLPNGGRLEVKWILSVPESRTSWQWRHISPSPLKSTEWVGAAPTPQQAMLDADHHARRCRL